MKYILLLLGMTKRQTKPVCWGGLVLNSLKKKKKMSETRRKKNSTSIYFQSGCPFEFRNTHDNSRTSLDFGLSRFRTTNATKCKKFHFFSQDDQNNKLVSNM